MPAELERKGLLWFLGGHALSSIGSKMQAAALLWHVYELTQSPVALGGLGALELIPLVLFASAGGVIADRRDRRWVLGLAQVAQAVPAVALGLMTVWGVESVPLLYFAALAGASGQAFDSAARKALVPRLAPAPQLGRVMAAVDMVKNVAKLAGPALMGILVASSGLALVYLLNAVSFAAMIVALLCLPVHVGAPEPRGDQVESAFASLVEGVRFAWSTPILRSLILLDFVATFAAAAEALLPMIADEVAGVGAAGYGLLASAAAAGALLGGAGILLMGPQRRLGLVAVVAVAVYGLATIAFGFSSTFWACFVCLACVGAADTASTVARNTLLQLKTPDGLRGRITSVGMVFSKSGPRLGQLEAGLVAAAFGLTASIVSGGVLCVLAAGWFAWRHPWLRE